MAGTSPRLDHVALPAALAGGQEAGLALLQELLQKPPAEVASWAIDQAGALSKPGADVERTALFQLAGALSSASLEQKQELVRSAVAGVEELPAQRKADALRLGMQTLSVVQEEAGVAAPGALEVLGLPAPALLAASGGSPPQQPQRAASAVSASSRPLLSAGSAATAATQPPPLLANLMRIGKEAKFHEMSETDLQVISQEADVSKLIMKPQQLLEVVQELKPEEREAITQKLVEAKVVPKEQQAVLEAAVRPGGYADQLDRLLRLGSFVVKYWLVIVGVPAAGFVLSLLLDALSCNGPLTGWLRSSAIQWLFMCSFAFGMRFFLAPGFQKLKADPAGVAQRWSSARGASDTASLQEDVRLRLQEAIPELPFRNVQISAGLLTGFALTLLLSVFWALVAMIRLVMDFFSACNPLVFLACAAFMVLHVGVLLGAAAIIYQAFKEVRRLMAPSEKPAEELQMAAAAAPPGAGSV